MKTPNGRAEIEAMFGNPANSDGTLNEAWEGANIRRVAPPDGWHLFYQADTGLVAVSSIRMHRLLEDTFLAVMDDIWNRAAIQLAVWRPMTTFGHGCISDSWIITGEGSTSARLRPAANCPCTPTGSRSIGTRSTAYYPMYT